VTVDIKPLGVLELWNRPSAGELAPWVRVAVAIGCVLGVVMIAASADVLWRMDGYNTGLNKDWFRKAPPIYMMIALAVVFLPGSTVSRWVRLAIGLPILHAIAMIVALVWVPSLDMPVVDDHTPMMRTLPPVIAFAGMLGLTVMLASMIGGRREWGHALVMIALANLLVLGLWLPIAAAVWARPTMPGADFQWQVAFDAVSSPRPLILTVLAPPLIVASLYTWMSLRAPRFAQRARNTIIVLLTLLFVFAVVSRVRNYRGAFLIYDNFVHVVLAVVMVAIVATVTLAVATWSTSRRTVRRLAEQRARTGVIDDDGDDVVACMQITSWLRGPRLWTRDFIARVDDNELVVPGGARLATEVPLVSSVMRIGEAVVVLKRGDVVKLGGFVDRQLGEDPFRSTTVTVPGPAGIVVGSERPVATPMQSMGMTAWRPSVAYLMILIVVGIPAIAGLFGASW
jgi:hypothetical protein